MGDLFQGKRIGILGLGPRTGVSLVRYVSRIGGYPVALDDRSPQELTENLALLSDLSERLEVTSPQPEAVDSLDFLLLSPGVSVRHPAVSRAKDRNIPVWSEIELAASRLKGKLIAITGTNGKSTTTSLIAHILKHEGYKVFAGGNLGRPLIEAVEETYDYVVAEISSFQLEAVEKFRPLVGVLLNISPNHLDRHETMEAYVALKMRLFACMEEEDCIVVNGDDPYGQTLAKETPSKVTFFSTQRKVGRGVFLEGDKISFSDGTSIPWEKSFLPGLHNRQNILAACAVGWRLGCSPQSMGRSISQFRGLPLRFERLGEFDGVEFVNDAKSTTPESTAAAMRAVDRPFIWVAGGRNKGAGYQPLAEELKRQDLVKQAIFFGEAATELGREFSFVPAAQVKTLDEAFARALGHAGKGDTILFSPALASFDQYASFEERGDHFSSLVRDHFGGSR